MANNVELVGVDTQANGYWRGRYGKAGYLLSQQNTDHIVVPSQFAVLTHGSSVRTQLVTDASMSSNPLLLEYDDGSNGNGQSFATQTASVTKYIPTVATAGVTVTYKVAVYISTLDGVTRDQQFSWQTSTGSIIYLADNFTIAGNTAMWRHYVINYIPTDRDIRLFYTGSSVYVCLVNGMFFDDYQPNSLGGFGFSFRGHNVF